MKIGDLEKLLTEIELYCDVESTECIKPVLDILESDAKGSVEFLKETTQEATQVWEIRDEIYEIMREHFREIDVK